MPESAACIQDPKYFEQGVSDYSDVVPLLQKELQDTEHTDFLSATHFGRQKEKKRLRQKYKKKCRSGQVYLRKDPCKSSASSMNRRDELSVVDSCVYWLSTLLSIC